MATSGARVSSVGVTAMANTVAHATMDRIPTPEIGLFDAPMSPAMYPQIPAIRNPTTSTNGTAMSVSVTALGARMVDMAKVYARYPVTTRQTIVSPMIHCGDMSRSLSSAMATAFEARSVVTSPPITGFESLARV